MIRKFEELSLKWGVKYIWFAIFSFVVSFTIYFYIRNTGDYLWVILLGLTPLIIIVCIILAFRDTNK